MLQLKAMHATSKTQRSQLNEYLKVRGGSSVTIENCNILGKEKGKKILFCKFSWLVAKFSHNMQLFKKKEI